MQCSQSRRPDHVLLHTVYYRRETKPEMGWGRLVGTIEWSVGIPRVYARGLQVWLAFAHGTDTDTAVP